MDEYYRCAVCGGLHLRGYSHDEWMDYQRGLRGWDEEQEQEKLERHLKEIDDEIRELEKSLLDEEQEKEQKRKTRSARSKRLKGLSGENGEKKL